MYREIEKLNQRDSANLPRLGSDLVGLVKVIVKSRGELPASLIAHATCRRSVVLELLEEGHNRGHKDFARLNMRRARRRAQALPEHGVMPELVHSAPEDGSLTKILNQKAATPHKVTCKRLSPYAWSSTVQLLLRSIITVVSFVIHVCVRQLLNSFMRSPLSQR